MDSFTLLSNQLLSVAGSVAEQVGIEVGHVILAINYESVLQLDHVKIVEALVSGGSLICIADMRRKGYKQLIVIYKNKQGWIDLKSSLKKSL